MATNTTSDTDTDNQSDTAGFLSFSDTSLPDMPDITPVTTTGGFADYFKLRPVADTTPDNLQNTPAYSGPHIITQDHNSAEPIPQAPATKDIQEGLSQKPMQPGSASATDTALQTTSDQNNGTAAQISNTAVTSADLSTSSGTDITTAPIPGSSSSASGLATESIAHISAAAAIPAAITPAAVTPVDPINDTDDGQLIAAILSEASYTPLSDYLNGTLTSSQYLNGSNAITALPDGWAVDLVKGESAEDDGGINQLITFVNTTTNQVVMAFKGSNNVSNFYSDLADTGAVEYNDIQAAAEEALDGSTVDGIVGIDTAYKGYQIVTDGHSLGGGLSQTFDVLNNLSGFGQNSLPIAPSIADTTAFTKAQDAWVANTSLSFDEVNMAGDPATLYYSKLQGLDYLDSGPDVLSNPYVVGELAGVALSTIPGIGAVIGIPLVAYNAAQAHSIVNLVTAETNDDYITTDSSVQNDTAITDDYHDVSITADPSTPSAIDIGQNSSPYFVVDPVTNSAAAADYSMSDDDEDGPLPASVSASDSKIVVNFAQGFSEVYVLDSSGALSSSAAKSGILPSGVSGTLASEVEIYSGLNGSGTNTSDILNYTNGTSQVDTFSSLATGATEEIQDYSEADAAGSLVSTSFDIGTGDVITLDQGTYSAPQYNNTSNAIDIGLQTPGGLSLGTLAIDAADGTDSLTLGDGMPIVLTGIADDTLTDVTESPLDILQSYLTELGDATGLSTLNYNYYNPTGPDHTIGPEADQPVEGQTQYAISQYTGPDGTLNGDTTTYNILNADSADLSTDTFNNVKELVATNTNAMTGEQFDDFSVITGDAFGGGTIIITTGGSYTLDSSRIQSTYNFTAESWDGTSLTGNDQANQVLTASLYGEDSLTAGNGADDLLVAGEGVDTLTGGTGGDYFRALDGLAAGSTVTGNSGTDDTTGTPTEDMLVAEGDISEANITGVEELVASDLTLTAQQLNSFTSISLLTSSATLYVTGGGNVSLEGITMGAFVVDAVSGSNTTITGADTADNTGAPSNFVADGSGNDTLIAGDGNGDSLTANGNGTDVLTAGDGDDDTLTINGGGNDMLSAGTGSNDSFSINGDGNELLTAEGDSASVIILGTGNSAVTTYGNNSSINDDGAGNNKLLVYGSNASIVEGGSDGNTGDNILQAGNADGDSLTAFVGTNTLIAGNGNDDSLTVYDSGNTLTVGNGTGDIISAAGGENIMNSGSSGATFNISDSYNQATGGSGNDTFNLDGSDNTDDGTIDLTGTTINGGGGINTLINTEDSGLDITVGSITNIQVIGGMSELTLTATQMAALTKIQFGQDGDGDTLIAATAGTYSVAAIDTTDQIMMTDGTSTGGVKLIDNNVAGDDLLTEENNDTLTAGNGAGDVLDAISGSNDILNGGSGGDTFAMAGINTDSYGGKGNDIFELAGTSAFAQGNGGSDTYVIASATGQDVINNYHTDTGSSVIVIEGTVTPAQLSLTRSGNDLIMTAAGTTTKVTIQNYFLSTAYQIAAIDFPDGTSWNTATINAHVTSSVETLTDGTSLTLTTNGNIIDAGNKDTVTMTASSSNTINISGSNNIISDNSASSSNTIADVAASVSNSYALGGSKDVVTLNGATDSATVSGTTDTVALKGTSDTAAVSGASETVSAGGTTDTLTITGSTEAVTASGASDTVSDATTDTGNKFTVSGSKDTVTLNGATGAATVSGASDTVTLNGATDSATVSGTTDTVALKGTSDTAAVSGASETVSAGGTTDTLTITGSTEAVTASGASDTVSDATTDTGNKFTVSGSKDTVTLNGATGAATVSGASDTVTLNGATDSATVSGTTDTVALKGTSDTAAVSGASETVSAGGTTDTLTITGSTEAVTASGASDTVSDATTDTGNKSTVSGSKDTVTLNGATGAATVSGASDTVTLNGATDSATVSGTTDTVALKGTSDTAAVSGASETVSAGGTTDTLTITGSTEAVTASGASDTVSDATTDTGNKFTVSGSKDTVTLNGATGAATVSGASDTVTLNGATDSATVSGTTDTVALKGTSDTAAVSGASETVSAGGTTDTLTITGSTEAVTASGASDTVSDATTDTGNKFTVSGSKDTVTLNGATGAATVSGASDTVTLNGATDSATVSGTTDTVALKGTSDTAAVSGASETVSAGGTTDTLTITGSTEAVTASGASDTVSDATTDTGNKFTVSGSKDTVTLNGATGAATVSGASDTVTLNGATDSATVSGTTDTVALKGTSDTAAVSGASETVSAGGTTDTLTITGSTEAVTASGASDTVSDATTDTGNKFTVSGSKDTVTLNGATGAATVSGASDTVTLNGATDSATVSGTTDTVALKGTSDTAAVSGASETVSAGGTTDTLTITGSTEAVTASGASDTVSDATTDTGNKFTVSGSKDTVTLNGSADSIALSGSGDTVTVNAATGSATISGTGNSLLLAGKSAEAIIFSSSTTGTLKLESPTTFTGTVAGLSTGNDIDLTSFLFSGTPKITSVTGTGAIGTNTDVTITDGTQSVMLALMNQSANQFAVNASAYALTADGTGTTAGTLFQLAAAP